MAKHLLTLKDYNKSELLAFVELGKRIKEHTEKYQNALKGKTLLMLFEKPSLRTRVSFEVGMTQLGGHAIYYDVSTSPLGKGKETVEDTARTLSRYVTIVMARVFDHSNLEKMAKNSSVPVINALSDFSHPCQILSDLLTIIEHKGSLKIKLAYLGDSNNNVTNSLLFAASIIGFNMSVGCPGGEFAPATGVMDFANNASKKSGAIIEVTNDPIKAVLGADVIYTDSWMSYHIPPEQKSARYKILKPYQVNDVLMKHAKKNAVFMHCLPATREEEVTASVLDGKQSIVFDQAENRLHVQKAIMLTLLDKV